MSRSTQTIQTYIDRVFQGEYLTIGQVAQEVGRSTRTLKRWKAEGKVECPRTWTVINGSKINLYKESDIDELRSFASTQRAGRPRKNAQEL